VVNIGFIKSLKIKIKMKNKLICLLFLLPNLIMAQFHDYSGSKATITGNRTFDPAISLYIVASSEDSLNLPSPASVSGQIIALSTGNILFNGIVRLNYTVALTYNPDGTPTVYNINYLPKIESTNYWYLISDGTIYKMYINYDTPASNAALIATLPIIPAYPLPTNVISQQLNHTFASGDFGQRYLLGSKDILFVMPTAASMTDKSFKIANHGDKNLKLSTTFLEGGFTRNGLAPGNMGNTAELYSDGTTFIKIGN
jgi:hypothetical protein